MVQLKAWTDRLTEMSNVACSVEGCIINDFSMQKADANSVTGAGNYRVASQ